MTKNSIVTRRAILALGGAALLSTAMGEARAALPFDRLKLIIGQSGGAVNDVIDRAFADAIKAEHPELSIDIENQAGSSGRTAFKSLLDAAGNGAMLGMLQSALLYVLLTDTEEAVAQFSTLNLIGSLGTDRRALFVAKSTGITSFQQVLDYKQPLIVPTINATSTSTADTAIVNSLTGSRIKAVPGYSSAERKLALLSGEANAAIGSISTYSDLVDQGFMVPVLRLNDAGPGAPYPEQPLLSSVASGPDAAVLVSLIGALARTQQLVAAPPGLTDNQVATLTSLFDAAAAYLPGRPGTTYQTIDVLPLDRHQVIAQVATFLSAPGAGDALRRAIACGQAMADGKACG